MADTTTTYQYTVDGITWNYHTRTEGIFIGKNYEYWYDDDIKDDNSNATTLGTELLSGTSGIITIPGSMYGNPVIGIGAYAFASNSNITSVIIPSTVTHIHDHAFDYCTSLINLSSNQDNQDGARFQDTSITHIFAYAFKATAIETLTISNNIKTLGTYVFQNCSNLTSLIFEDGCQLDQINARVFQGCTQLDNIEIPSSIKVLNNFAFQACSGLTTITFAGDGLETILQSVFHECTSLQSINIPSSVTIIGNNAFEDSALETINFAAESKLEDIQYYAFNNANLSEISIPASVTVPTPIWGPAFQNNDNLHTVNLWPTTAQAWGITFGTSSQFGSPATTSWVNLNPPPVVTLNGETEINLFVDETYTEAGATAIDGNDDSVELDVTIVGSVDTSTIGTYSITYSATGITYNDTTVVTRTVIISHRPTCFPAGTLITTDNGVCPIEKLNSNHLIRGSPIVKITRSTGHRYIINIPKNSLCLNVPSCDTKCSLEHKIFYQGVMLKARNLVSKCAPVRKVPHDGTALYNVLLNHHGVMNVNNLICETLHPQRTSTYAHGRTQSQKELKRNTTC